MALAMLMTCAVYWPGLSGPYVLDDVWNLAPVQAWARGDLAWQAALLPNPDSVLFSRPVSMASFLASAWLMSPTPFAFKLGNLALHLACGGLGGLLLGRLLRLDLHLARLSGILGAAGSSVWLLHPMHASTVLYAVQRMAQLAALFSLLAVLSYVQGRRELEAGRYRAAMAWLFFVVPGCLAAGLFAKQNAAVAPLLCLVLEIAYFQRSRLQAHFVWMFHGVFVAAPTLALFGVLWLDPATLLDGYGDMDMTMGQRLLTQPRALLNYLGTWFLPRTPEMGLYTDAYPVSRSLLEPASTLFAALLLLAVSGAAVLVRRQSPSVFAGWFFFVGAHAVESSFLPLEVYYEHRNYLPAFGLLLCACGLGGVLSRRFGFRGMTHRQSVVLCGAVLAILAFATLGRALLWQSADAIIEQGIRQHPESLRAHLDRTSVALSAGRFDDAADALQPMAGGKDERNRFVAGTALLLVNCVRGKDVDAGDLMRLASTAPPILTARELYVAELIQDISVNRLCPRISDEALGDALAVMLARAEAQREASTTKALFRNMTAQAYVRAASWEKARAHASVGWEATGALSIGAILAFVYASEGDVVPARKILSALQPMITHRDAAWQQRLEEIERVINDAEGG